MWRLKQLIPKEQAGLEGKTVEVGSLRLQIRSTIAEGGFSCVYLGKDAQSGKLFAIKHIVCNDTESLDLVRKEVNALKAMRGHPNIIFLHAQSMYDMGRTKECFIVTEYCEKMMVDVLDSRGAGFFEEKQLLLMFRDICNAVYAMHCQSPPMAHRDLKAENLLLGSDGQWKLCDFGSISTNHQRFEKAAEMGVEEDIIRKHTTPAYRAPEMWDLYRRELINEKVDIWALGCLLYRMAYLKSAFDGDSKLQILNGNYRIPDIPKYSANITGLIKDMLNSSPDARPTAMQVWQRVNSSLPAECQKVNPDKAPSSSALQDNAVQGKSPSLAPTRSPPPPPQRAADLQKETDRSSSSLPSKEADQGHTSSTGKGTGVGSFWSTQYAQEARHDDDKSSAQSNSTTLSRPHGSVSASPPQRGTQNSPASSSSSEPRSVRSNFLKNRVAAGRNYTRPGDDDFKLNDANGEHDVCSKQGLVAGVAQTISSIENVNHTSQEAFNEFVADFQNASIFTSDSVATVKEGQVELESLKNELKQAEREKAEITSKYDKLTTICRSQRLEIQELKAALATANVQNASLQRDSVAQGQPPSSFSSLKPDSQVGTIWDLHQGMSSTGNSSETQGWRAFDDGPSKQITSARKDHNQDASRINTFGSTRFDIAKPEASKIGFSSEGNKNLQTTGEAWGLHDSFAALGAGFTAVKGVGQVASGGSNAFNGNSSKGAPRPATLSQPSGWSNF